MDWCCAKRPRQRRRRSTPESTGPNQERDDRLGSLESDPRVVHELQKLAGSGIKTVRLRFGEAGAPAWIKILKSGTRRPEVALLVNGTPRRFRARCLPQGTATLDDCESLEREAQLPTGAFDALVPARCQNCLVLVTLLGIDEHMNLCFRPTKPWNEE